MLFFSKRFLEFTIYSCVYGCVFCIFGLILVDLCEDVSIILFEYNLLDIFDIFICNKHGRTS